jgi:GNAT superfamily N-acetyltransferase
MPRADCPGAADTSYQPGAIKYLPMPDWPLALRRADTVDVARIVGLIDEAAEWLKRCKNTDQWARPWPNRAGRDSRVLASLRAGKTWICWDRSTPAATLTADPEPDSYWMQLLPSHPAVYVHRLVVARSYAGLGLGAALLNWAGRTGRLAHGAYAIRVSAWTTNSGLHQYYYRQGFSLTGFHPDDGYPSAARFEKLTSIIPFYWPPLFSAPSRLVEP